jgi:hypothetical protein
MSLLVTVETCIGSTLSLRVEPSDTLCFALSKVQDACGVGEQRFCKLLSTTGIRHDLLLEPPLLHSTFSDLGIESGAQFCTAMSGAVPPRLLPQLLAAVHS